MNAAGYGAIDGCFFHTHIPCIRSEFANELIFDFLAAARVYFLLRG
jgi:hypothetical protein